MADLDLDDHQLFQDSRHVRTKFRKAIPTWFFPVGDHFVGIVEAWKRELQEDHGYGPSAPLFPKTQVSFGPDGSIQPAHLGTECWADAGPIRTVFKESCAAAGLPDFNPHSLRHMLAQIGLQRSRSPEEMKAWSQNLGHESVMTTFTSYGTVPDYRQREIILAMKTSA